MKNLILSFCVLAIVSFLQAETNINQSDCSKSSESKIVIYDFIKIIF